MRHIVLASSSPRRKELLESAGYTVHVRIPDADETWPGGGVEDAVVALAQRKLAKVGAVDGLVIAADTVVHDGEPLGKPSDARAATAMLERLSGREHTVVTGFVVAHGARQHREAVTTRVVFRQLTAGEIAAYVATGDCLDKAGAYGIQGRGGALVAWVEGSYTNVVGLPLSEVVLAVDAVS